MDFASTIPKFNFGTEYESRGCVELYFHSWLFGIGKKLLSIKFE